MSEVLIRFKYSNLIYVTLLESDSACKVIKGHHILRLSEVTGFTSHLRLFGFTFRYSSELGVSKEGFALTWVSGCLYWIDE